MNYNEYIAGLSKIRASRLNKITNAVNCRVPRDEIGLKSDIEVQYYENLMKEAKAHEKKYGFWPTFDMDEIESDDPALDIYKD